LLALMFGPLERAFPARPLQRVLRRDVLVDACFFFGQFLVWAVLFLVILVPLGNLLDHLVPTSLRAVIASLPFAVQAILAVAAGDLLVYWWHRACHVVPLLWRFHAVHHSAVELDWVAAFREHPLDGLTTQLAQNLPAFVLGFPLETIGAFVALRGAWAIFVHSNVRVPLGPLRVLLGAPELHHWHHAKVERTRHNFANLAPWLDVLFGTYHRPAPGDYALGIPEDRPRRYLSHLIRPFFAGPA
jgi:sterol desaturase/sphingolipid hydroxylase (fatty acid hydroxylase superfamily)